MHDSVKIWFSKQLPVSEQKGRTCLEVGSLDCGGQLRDVLTEFDDFVGLDMRPGAGVDVVSAIEDWDTPQRFDFVISAGTLEHVEHWQAAITAMKRYARPAGEILLTTVRPGFGRHDYPSDYWRFTKEIMEAAFADCTELVIDDRPEAFEIFVRARAPALDPIFIGGIEAVPV